MLYFHDMLDEEYNIQLVCGVATSVVSSVNP
jgi:hypothetical protein